MEKLGKSKSEDSDKEKVKMLVKGFSPPELAAKLVGLRREHADFKEASMRREFDLS